MKKVSAALVPLALGVLMCVIKCILCVPYNLLWGYELEAAGIEPKTAEEKVFQDLEWVRKNEEECCIKLSLLKESWAMFLFSRDKDKKEKEKKNDNNQLWAKMHNKSYFLFSRIL